MSNINIDKNITPHEKITFQVTMEFYGYSQVREFQFRAPKACPQLNKLNNVFLEKGNVRNNKVTSKTYNFTKYTKVGKIDNNFYRLKVLMTGAKASNELVPGEKVIFTSSGKLAALNGKTFTVIKSNDNNINPKIIHLKVNKDYQPNPNPTAPYTNTQSGSLQEVNRIEKIQRIKVIPPEIVFDGLVKQIDIGAPKKGNVDDIIVYAYKQFEGNNSAQAVRKLMLDDSEINEKKPPSRQTVLEYRKARSYAKDFKIDDDKTIICYISVARYTYNGTGWTAEWLQQNKLDQAIWARASEKK